MSLRLWRWYVTRYPVMTEDYRCSGLSEWNLGSSRKYYESEMLDGPWNRSCCMLWQVLTYGAEWQVILKATDADGSCVLACALAASYLLTQNNFKGKERSPEAYLNAAKSNLVL